MHKYSLEKLKEKAENLSHEISAPFSILLKGDLGSGKTTFSKFFIKPILIDSKQNVTSPTFNIIQIYETTKGQIWHVDLYRLKKEDEIFELGLLEAMFTNICIIEWPEILKNHLPKNAKYLEINL